MAPPVPPPAAVPRALVGAIRWDAWSGGATTRIVERTLGPKKYHSRLPWFAKVKGENGVSIEGGRREIVDAEIEYAAGAGLDYWAFVLYPRNLDLSVPLGLYLSSAVRDRIRFCVVITDHILGEEAVWPGELERLVSLMGSPAYQKVMGNRPLVYLYWPEMPADGYAERFAELRAAATRAVLLNYTNPETKLCEAVTRLTNIQAYGLCHGIYQGMGQVSQVLGRRMEDLEMAACGMNHFTWFQRIRDRKTGEDLYPLLRRIEAGADPVAEWHELAMARILFRRFGLWPSPAPNHYGEYVSWAEEFVAHQVQYYHDPMDGAPWRTGRIPEFVYSLSYTDLKRDLKGPWGGGEGGSWENEMARDRSGKIKVERVLKASGEGAAAIMEAMTCGVAFHLPAVNIRNNGSIPNLPDDMVVEVPADIDAGGMHPWRMEPLPEGIVGLLRPQASIHKLLVEAFAEKSKNKLVQAILLDPTCRSYRAAVDLVDEMIRLQKGMLPPLN